MTEAPQSLSVPNAPSIHQVDLPLAPKQCPCILNIYLFLFMYLLTALGLSCGTQGLPYGTQASLWLRRWAQ